MARRPSRNHGPAFKAKIALATPSRKMNGLLRQEGFTAGRLHVATCMKTMGIDRYLAFYNASRSHSSLDGQTPDQAYRIKLQPILVAT